VVHTETLYKTDTFRPNTFKCVMGHVCFTVTIFDTLLCLKHIVSVFVTIAMRKEIFLYCKQRVYFLRNQSGLA
jgi:hypothetical protein